ncbi:MAG: dienelactone hydrolase family protein [Pseudomonadota bacterium]
MIEQSLEYETGGVTFEARVCWDDDLSAPRPAVLISHAWGGRSDFENGKAKALASLGYVGIAIDLYGKGVLGTSREENAGLMQPLLDDRGLLQNRIAAALTAARTLEAVDASRVSAIGFCFGGLCVLDLARCGADVNGVASFHGLLGAPANISEPRIEAKVLILHGHDDPMAPVEDVINIEKEMTGAGADWQIHVYGNTMHSFTNPNANDPDFGTVYDESADRRSWRTLLGFLEEVSS